MLDLIQTKVVRYLNNSKQCNSQRVIYRQSCAENSIPKFLFNKVRFAKGEKYLKIHSIISNFFQIILFLTFDE
jgi:hypothetical protein